jgi:metal-dependent amidase/aminoacylase/carboxypeptidase family protein
VVFAVGGQAGSSGNVVRVAVTIEGSIRAITRANGKQTEELATVIMAGTVSELFSMWFS